MKSLATEVLVEKDWWWWWGGGGGGGGPKQVHADITRVLI